MSTNRQDVNGATVRADMGAQLLVAIHTISLNLASDAG